MVELAVNPDRLLSDLQQLRQFGAVGTGVARQAFSDPDIASRRWLMERISEAGLEAVVDHCGNVFGLPRGDAPCVLVGSHSDSQPLGGWLDGAYGVICGLELARAAQETGSRPIAVVSFQDEEGRFGGLTGSSVWSGAWSLEDADNLKDTNGVSFGEARKRVGEIGTLGEVSHSRFSAFIEAHIEQGPVLDMAEEAVGIVENIVGVRSLHARFEGEANHAGTTPMPLRRDALQCAVNVMTWLNAEFARVAAAATVWTFGRLAVEPNADSIVPGGAELSIQLRDASAELMDRMIAMAERAVRETAQDMSIEVTAERGLDLEPVPMNAEWVDRLSKAANEIAPGRWRRMPSGALHDASWVSLVLPTAMLFVPSIGGISHNPAENTDQDDLAAGLAVLSHVLLAAD